MTLLFGRATTFEIGEAGGQARQFLLQKDPKTGQIQQIRTKFKIENSSVGDIVNKAEVSLYNLSQDSRNYIEQLSNGTMTLRAGYNPGAVVDPVLPIAFSGKTFWVVNKKEGPDTITTIESGMNLNILTDAVVSFSQESILTPGQLLNLIKQACATVGLGVGDIDPGFLATSPWLQGLCFLGTLAAFLTAVVNPTGLVWTIQDNALNIFDPKNPPVLTGVLLTKDTGMIGVPTTSAGNAPVNTDDTIDKTPVFTVQSLFNPLLTPGRQVKVLSTDSKYNGFFTIRTAKHEGDTLAGPWTTELEGQWVANLAGPGF